MKTTTRFPMLCTLTLAALMVWLAPLAAQQATPAPAAVGPMRILLPLNRTAYQTNETIDLSVVRSGSAALPAGNLTLTLVGEQGSKLVFTFPVPAVPLKDGSAVATENLHLNGWLLRPGKYAVEAAVDDALAKAEIELYSHIRKSTFRLITWGGANGKEILEAALPLILGQGR
jgi:hypothetical protein